MTAGGPALWKQESLLTITWEVMAELLVTLADEIRRSRFEPDLVAGISRGGLPPAVYLANTLGAPDFCVLGIRRNLSNMRYSQRQPPSLDYVAPDVDLSGRRVLLVDDIVGEGSTMELALQAIRSRRAAELRTAAVALNANARAIPDFFGVRVDDWTVFPWEKPIQAGEAARRLGVPAPDRR